MLSKKSADVPATGQWPCHHLVPWFTEANANALYDS
jgi:hypothetical protein